MTQRQYVTLCDAKVYPHTKFGIPTSNDIGGYAPYSIFLELRPEVKESDLKIVHNTPDPTHGIWDFYLKEYRIHAPAQTRLRQTHGRTDSSKTICPQSLVWGGAYSSLDKQRICVNTQLKLSKKQLKLNVCVPKSNSVDQYAITCDVYHLVHFVSISVIYKCQSGIDFFFTSERPV